MPDQPSHGVLLLGGTRTHQEGYARAFAADSRCRLVAVADEADVPPERAALNRQLAAELHLPYVPSLDEGLAQPGVDLVSVCVEHERRARVAVRCAQARKQLYLDKPIACTVPGARAVAAAVREAGVRSQMFSFVHTPWAQAARQALRDGAVGELRAIHAEAMFAKGHAGTASLGTPRQQEPFPRRFTFIDSKRELRATGVYALSLIRWLTQVEVRSVWADTANYFFAEHQRNDVEDFGLMSLERSASRWSARPARSPSTPISRGWRSTPTRSRGPRPRRTPTIRWASGSARRWPACARNAPGCRCRPRESGRMLPASWTASSRGGRRKSRHRTARRWSKH
jgi:myo-inositol 2-dehydrogenase / D-chiro-inositol 1-dehydrogenase